MLLACASVCSTFFQIVHTESLLQKCSIISKVHYSFIDSHFSVLTMSLDFEERYFILPPLCAISAI